MRVLIISFFCLEVTRTGTDQQHRASKELKYLTTSTTGLVNTPKTMVLLPKRTPQQVEIVWSAPHLTWRAPRPPGTNCTIASEPLGRLMSRTEHMCDVTMHGSHVGSGDSEGMFYWSQLLQRQPVLGDLFWIQPDNQMLKSKTLACSRFLWSYAVTVNQTFVPLEMLVNCCPFNRRCDENVWAWDSQLIRQWKGLIIEPKFNVITHFQVCLKPLYQSQRPGAQLFKWKWVKFACELNLIFIWKDGYQGSLEKEAKDNLEMACFEI